MKRNLHRLVALWTGLIIFVLLSLGVACTASSQSSLLHAGVHVHPHPNLGLLLAVGLALGALCLVVGAVKMLATGVR